MKFTNVLDLDQNAIINIPLDPRAQAPASPVFGQIYTNNVDKNIQYWNGTRWVILGGVTNITNTDGAISVSDDNGVYNLGLNLDNSTLEIAAGVVRIKDSGVTTAKIKDAGVTSIKILDKNITFAKINDIPTMTVIGRTTAGTGVSSAIPIINSNDLVGANGTSLVTSGAVKAYVDASISSLGKFIGGWDAALQNVFPGDITTKKGDFWRVTTKGTILTEKFEVGDIIVAGKDNPLNTNINDYLFLQTNVDQASTTYMGLVVLATNAEVQTGTDGNKVITPSSLSSRTATETRTGLARVATSAEALTGTDNTTIMTPKKVMEVVAAKSNNGYSALFGGGVAVEFNITHNLKTEDLVVNFYEMPGQKACIVDYTVTTIDAIMVYVGKPIAANSLKVVIIPKG